MLKTIKFLLKHRKGLKLLLKDINEVKTAVHEANLDKKIDRGELTDILREVDDVLERVIDIVEE